MSITVMLHDKARSPLPGYIGPNPLHKDTDSKTRLSQKLQMDRNPDHPRRETTEMNLAALQDCETFADNCEVSFVEVAEWTRRRLTCDLSMNKIACVASLLHCYLRHAR